MRKDFLQINDDLSIKNGDFEIADSDNQHMKDIVDSSSNDYKEFPFIGANMALYLNSSGKKTEIEGLLKKQLELDGYKKAILNVIEENKNLTIQISQG